MSEPTLPIIERPICIECNSRPCARRNHQGKTYFRKYCCTCADKKYKDPEKKKLAERRASFKYNLKKLGEKLKPCTICGFVPVDGCQMDWDHINGIHFDNRLENFQLLCANCHRLKTKRNRDNISSAFIVV